MRPSWKLEILIAALVVLLAAPLLLAGDDGGSAQRVTVVSGSNVQELSLKDFEDGETRTLEGIGGEITVTREGDVLKVKLPDEQLVLAPGKAGHAFIVKSGDDDARVRQWVTVNSNAEGDHDSETYVFRGDDGSVVELKDRPFWVSSDDRVLYRCPKDDVELVVPKKDATMESFTCPVCGTAMAKADEGAQVRRHVIVKITSDKDVSEDVD